MDFSVLQSYLGLVLQSYWGVILVVLGFGVYTIFQRQNAKKIILSLMLRLEKEAETLALTTGDAKFQFVVDKGYQLLPQGARIFITPAMFKALAQTLYDEAKKYLEKYLHTDEPVLPPVSPSEIPPVDPVQAVPVPTDTTVPTQQATA